MVFTEDIKRGGNARLRKSIELSASGLRRFALLIRNRRPVSLIGLNHIAVGLIYPNLPYPEAISGRHGRHPIAWTYA
jgi:hypothetical protein